MPKREAGEKKMTTHFCVATSSLGGVHRDYPCLRIVITKCTKTVKYGDLTADLALFPGVSQRRVSPTDDKKFGVSSILGDACGIDDRNVIGALNC